MTPDAHSASPIAYAKLLQISAATDADAALPSGYWPAGAKTERIEHYTVRKPPPLEKSAPDLAAAHAAAQKPAGEPTDRTLAAIVPHGEQGWFFKLTGPKDAVAATDEAFTTFLKSIHFSADGKPEWTLPEGWQEQPGIGDSLMRRWSFRAMAQPLELSVTALPKPPGDEENYALVNINRWRGQLKLPPIAREQLAAESTQLEARRRDGHAGQSVGHRGAQRAWAVLLSCAEPAMASRTLPGDSGLSTPNQERPTT